MLNYRQKARGILSIARILLPIISFIIPIVILYSLDSKSFEITWKGRTYYLFFLWLLFLETFLNWRELEHALGKIRSLRTGAFVVSLSFPTIYVVTTSYYGLNTVIANLSGQYKIPFADWMPLSTEYLVLTVLFVLIVSLGYGIGQLMNLSISTLFLGAIGAIYTIDNLYPYGRFTLFQIIVPTTANLAMNVLNLMGYHTLWIGNPSNMPTFIAWNSQGNYSSAFSIAWPCSGVESLIIYTVTILLFLKKTPISWPVKAVYFAIGAAITYFINVLRIATIFTISINGGSIEAFHNFYGQLYSISWIMAYPLVIIGTQLLWATIRSRRSLTRDISKD
jgi:thaumarchaeosortase